MSIGEHLRQRATRAATNQSFFRDRQFNAITQTGQWNCECANDICTARVTMSSSEYAAHCADGARFVVAPSDEHVWLDAERVTKRCNRYWIVEKIGDAGRLAKQGSAPSRPDALRTMVKFLVFLDGVPARAPFSAVPAPGQIFRVPGGPYARVTSVRSDGDGNRVVGAKRVGPRIFPPPGVDPAGDGN